MTYRNLATLFRKSYVISLSVLIIPIFGAGLMAQDDETDDVFELNPFEVSSTSGYIAQRTLAGTRLNSELVNVPQQISVFTADFLDDIAATSPQDAMLYSLNVENLVEFAEGGSGDNYNQGINFNNFGGRVRGIATSGRMRDFFETDLEADTYNIDQISVSSGPNAVIFGLGGTGGIINSSFKKAELNDTFYTIGTRVDSEESIRLTLDVNQEVIEDKLAVRAVGLWDDFNTYRNSTWGEQERYYLTLTARPWKGATVRAYYEDVDIRKVLPRNVVAYDGGVTAYMEHVANGGDPYYDNSISNAILPGWEGLVQRSTQGSNRPTWVLPLDGDPVNVGRTGQSSLNWVRTIDPSTEAPVFADRFRWSLPEDSPISNVEHNVHGQTTGRHMYGDIYGIIYNQQITPDLHIELGFNHEKGYTDFWNMAQPGAAVIRIDPNLYLPDKVTPNPWKGMMFVEDWGQSTQDYNELWGWRATVSYNLDLTEVNKYLGRHQFMGLYTKDRNDRFWYWMRTKMIAADDVDSYTYNAGSGGGQGQNYFRWYLDPVTNEMINPFDPLDGGLQPDGNFVWALGNSPAGGFTWSSLQSRKGATAAIQSFWFDDRLVTTVGYRAGWFESGGAQPKVGSGEYQGVPYNWGYERIAAVDRSLDSFGEELSEDAINYGAVLHLTSDDSKFGKWSIFYNYADIFNSPTPGHFPDDSGIPAAVGDSYDYGIIWTGFDNKAGFRINWYNTVSDNANNCNWCGYIRNRVNNIEKQIGAPGRVSTDEDNYATSGENYVDISGNPVDFPVAFDPSTYYLEGPGSYWHMVANRESSGVEIEAWANPTPNWTFRLTAAENEAVDLDGLRGYEDWVLQRFDYWKAWAEWEQTTYIEGNTQPLANGGGSIVNNFNIMAPAFTTLQNSDGVRVSQNAGWRVNFTGRYSFKEGKLKGAHIGAHLRFRESPAIGYYGRQEPNAFAGFPGSPDIVTAPDLDRPVFAPDRKDFDLFAGYNGRLNNGKIRYTVRLNVRNVFDDDDIMPQRARSDGSIGQYSYKPPRTFILSLNLTY